MIMIKQTIIMLMIMILGENGYDSESASKQGDQKSLQ